MNNEFVGTKVLRKFPLHKSIAESSDKGTPIVLSSPKSPDAKCYRGLAKELIAFLENQEKKTE